MVAFQPMTEAQKQEIIKSFVPTNEYDFISTDDKYYVTVISKGFYAEFQGDASWETIAQILGTNYIKQNYKLYDKDDKVYVLEYIFF